MWSHPDHPPLLERLLHDLDSQLSTSSPNELRGLEKINVAWPKLKECLQHALKANCPERCSALAEKLGNDGTPLTLLNHQFGVLRNLVLGNVLDRGEVEEARAAFSLFTELEEAISTAYLRGFLASLRERNGQRLEHIRALEDKNILVYFESHLEWIERLIDAVAMNAPVQMPELDHTRCEFGQWLHGNELIRDANYQESLQQMHAAMHHVVAEIRSILEHPRASAAIYGLLKKAETYSLELGSEISLLNNVVIMSVYNKDPLTGFLSRRFMERVMLNQMEIARATEAAFSLIMFDLDHFKQINDSHGHQTGDRVLEHVAAIVRSSLRQSDLVFRYGGEEFLVVLPSTGIQQARQLAEKLRQRIAQSPLPGDEALPITASFGVLQIAPDSYKVVDMLLVRDLIDECDARLYNAKHRGRNCVV